MMFLDLVKFLYLNNVKLKDRIGIWDIGKAMRTFRGKRQTEVWGTYGRGMEH